MMTQISQFDQGFDPCQQGSPSPEFYFSCSDHVHFLAMDCKHAWFSQYSCEVLPIFPVVKIDPIAGTVYDYSLSLHEYFFWIIPVCLQSYS